MRVKRELKGHRAIKSAGTKLPAWASTTSSATFKWKICESIIEEIKLHRAIKSAAQSCHFWAAPPAAQPFN